MSRRSIVLWLFVFACSFTLGPLRAATTGSVSGLVVDQAGSKPLAGVTVSIRSPAQLGGVRATSTDASGRFELLGLVPGTYTVTFDRDGYLPLAQPAVTVHVDRDAQLRVELASTELAETVTVKATAPIVDTQRTAQGQVLSEDYLQGAAIGAAGRTYQAILGQSAGVVGTGNPNVFGSLDNENVYLIDGANTTDPVTATFGTNFNYDAIQEISFQTAGYEAEYGQAIGGLVNLVTKSGGNNVSGTVDVRYGTNRFQQSGPHFDAGQTKTRLVDPSVTVGGPLHRDRLWFFVSGEDIDSQRTPSDSPTTRNFRGRNYLLKLSAQLNPAWRLVGKYSNDPATIDNINAGRFVQPEAAAQQRQGGPIAQAEASGLVGRDWLIEARVGFNRQRLDVVPMSGDVNRPGIVDDTNGVSSLNYSNAQFSNRDRDEYSANVTRMLTGGTGEHDLKLGLEGDTLRFRARNFTTGDAVYVDRSGSIRQLQVSPRQPAFDFDGKLWSSYLQDAWRPTPRLTVRLGVRYDDVKYRNDTGFEVANLHALQPRLGVAWDATGDGRTVVRASWGRFLHPNALTMPSFARSTQSETDFYFSCSRYTPSLAACRDFAESNTGAPAVIIQDPLHRDSIGFWLLTSVGSAPNQIQKGLRPTTADTFTIGAERQLGESTSIEVFYIEKRTSDVFEDTCNGNVPTPHEGAACDFFEMANISGLRREYRGAVLRVESRVGDRLRLNGSYVYSTSRGNVEDTQNGGTDFDFFPAHYVNRFGYLSDDRRQRLKLDGYAHLPFDLTLGVNAFWSSAFAWSVTEPADPYGTLFVEPRGSRRGGSNWQIDLQLAKGFKIARAHASVIAAIFNATNAQQTTSVCGTFGGCGTIPLGGATDFQQPRRFEVGARLEF